MAANIPAVYGAVYGMYNDEVALQSVVRTLNQAGFKKADICMMLSPNHPIAAALRETKTNIVSGERSAVAAGAELTAWLMKFGAVVIPNVSLFVGSPAFLQALVANEESRPAHHERRPLIDLGFLKEDALRLEQQLDETGVLVYVSCPEAEHATSAIEVLRRTGALEAASLQRERALQVAA